MACCAVFNYAVKRDYIVRSPCRDIELPAPLPVKRRPVTASDLSALDAALVDQGLMVYIGAIGGLRWGEVAGLRVRHCDLLHGELTVAEQITRGEGGISIVGQPTKTCSSTRGSHSQSTSRPLGCTSREHGLTAADGDEFLFTTADGGPLDYCNWRRRSWIPACIKAGLGDRVTGTAKRKTYKGLGFHDLRRASATALVALGVDVKTAQARLGHADAKTTLNIYASKVDANDRAAAEALAAEFYRR